MALKKKTMRIKFWVYMRNSGDGSSYALLFRTLKEAEQEAAEDDERNTEDIQECSIVIDPVTSAIIELK